MGLLMGRIANPVSALAITKRLSKTDGMHAMGGHPPGLYLYVRGTCRLWMLRYSIRGRRRDLTLANFADKTLEEARDLAMEARKLIREGSDPLEQKKAARVAEKPSLTFRACAEAYITAHSAGWKNPKHKQQWENTLASYVYPTLGDRPVAAIDTPQVLDVLKDIWTEKNETASRVRGRIESILDWATVQKHRSGENPARWKGHLALLLAPRTKVKKVEHHAALPYAKASNFMDKLRKAAGTGARALEFLILCAARSSEVRGLVWPEVDLENKVWIIPPERMKGGREHRVPLSDKAVELLEKTPRNDGTDLVFPGSRKSGHFNQLSDMTLTAVLRRLGYGDFTVHGFRSTFRDWTAETTHYPNEMAELALAHAVGDKTEAAYRRGDMFEKRRGMMQEWADHLSLKAEEQAKKLG
jgi:integrase